MLREKLIRIWENPLIVLIRKFYWYSLIPYISILFVAYAYYPGMVWLANRYPTIYEIMIFFLSIMSYISIPVFIYIIVRFFTLVYYVVGDIGGCCWDCCCARRSDKISKSWKQVIEERSKYKKI